MNSKQLMLSILQQAISGQLVDQLENEPEVEQVGNAPSSDVVPFEIPTKWKWVQLNTVAEYNPDIQADDNLDVSFTPLEDLSFGFKTELTFNQIKSWSKVKKGYKRYQDGDVIFAKITPSFQNRKSGLVANAHNGIGCGSTEFCVYRCQELLFNKYLLWFFKSAYFIDFGKSTFKGTAGQQRVNLDAINSMYLPLPPIEEQRRIVARLDEIRPLVEKFDEAQEQLVKLEAEFPSKLKASVLQQAIRGELVPQLDCEPEVEQVGPAPKPDEVPFKLPPKWKWARFSHLINCLDSMRIPVKKADRDKQQKVYDYYGATGVIDQVEDYIFDKRLLLIGEDGANLLSRSKDNAFFAEGKYWVNNHAHVFDENGLASLDYLAIYINAISLAPYVTGSAQPKLTLTRLKSIWTPLPPLEEQRRIVAKVEELLAGVKQLSSLMEYA